MLSSPSRPEAHDPFQSYSSTANDPFASSTPAYTDPFASTPATDPFASTPATDPFASPAVPPPAGGYTDPFASAPTANNNPQTPIVNRILQARIDAKVKESEGKAAPRPLTPHEQESIFASSSSPHTSSKFDSHGNNFTDPFSLPADNADPFAAPAAENVDPFQNDQTSNNTPGMQEYLQSFEQQQQVDSQQETERASSSGRQSSWNANDSSSDDDAGYSPGTSGQSPSRSPGTLPSPTAEEEYEAYFDESCKKYGMLLEKAKRLAGDDGLGGLASVGDWIGTGGDRLSSSSSLRYSHGSVGGPEGGATPDDRTSVSGALSATTYTHECEVDEGRGEAEVTAVKLVVDDGASAAAGITVGSVLLAVNGVSVQHLSYKDALKLVRDATRPTTLKLVRVTRPFDLSHGEIMARVSNGSWSVGGMRKGRANWSNKYYAFGGPQGDVFQLFDNRLAYQQATVDSVERKKSRHKVLTFKLHEQYRCGRIKCKPYRSHGQLFYFKLKVPSLAFVPAKFAFADKQAVQLLHDTLTVKLNTMKMNAGKAR